VPRVAYHVSQHSEPGALRHQGHTALTAASRVRLTHVWVHWTKIF
jgi:hypothetical protein